MATRILKRDLFGEVRLGDVDGRPVIVRDCGGAPIWVRWFARWMLSREAAALALLEHVAGVPKLVSAEKSRLTRSYIAGEPLYRARIREPAYYTELMRLVRRVHTAGVVHNDLAKEPNLLVDEHGRPAVIDFQLAVFPRRRHRLFRIMGREDIRHVLKHKRYYCAEHLTARERRILDNPALLSRLFRNTFKPVYTLITRRILGWADREGAERTKV
jgi:RIO-like serine/threonine protein kinase